MATVLPTVLPADWTVADMLKHLSIPPERVAASAPGHGHGAGCARSPSANGPALRTHEWRSGGEDRRLLRIGTGWHAAAFLERLSRRASARSGGWGSGHVAGAAWAGPHSRRLVHTLGQVSGWWPSPKDPIPAIAPTWPWKSFRRGTRSRKWNVSSGSTSRADHNSSGTSILGPGRPASTAPDSFTTRCDSEILDGGCASGLPVPPRRPVSCAEKQTHAS